MATKTPQKQQKRRHLDILLLTTGNVCEQPLLLGQAATYLRQQGFMPRLRDLAVQPLADEREIAALATDLVVIGITSSTQLAASRDLIRRLVPLLAGRGALCCFGPAVGPAMDTLLTQGAHACIAGEWVAALVNIAWHMQHITMHTTSSADAPGAPFGCALALCELDGVRTHRYATRPHTRRAMPDVAPSRDLMPPLSAYTPPPWATIDLPVPAWGQVVTTRQALLPCTRCPLAQPNRSERIDHHVILQDISALVMMGATHISFADDDFLVDYEQSIAVVQDMSQLYPGLSFDFRTSVLSILRLPDIVTTLRSLGATGIGLVLDETPGTLHDGIRGVSLAQLEAALAFCSRHGFRVHPTLRPCPNWQELTGAGSTLLERRSRHQGHALRDSAVPSAIALECLASPGRIAQQKRGKSIVQATYNRLMRRNQATKWQRFAPEHCPEARLIATGGCSIPCCIRP